MVLKTLTRFLGMLGLLFSLGCASAYYNNPCCSIDCRYTAPNSLPYTKYDARDCHSGTVLHYLEPRPVLDQAEEKDIDEDSEKK